MNLIAKITLFIALLWGGHTTAPMVNTAPLTTTVNTPVVSVVQAASTTSATTTELFILTNYDRGTEGLPPLVENSTLMTDAQTRANFFCTAPFGHWSDGLTPWDFFKNYVYHYAGENLAQGFDNVPQMEAAFMASPEHKSNIEDTNYTDVGIGWACGITTVEFGSQW